MELINPPTCAMCGAVTADPVYSHHNGVFICWRNNGHECVHLITYYGNMPFIPVMESINKNKYK